MFRTSVMRKLKNISNKRNITVLKMAVVQHGFELQILCNVDGNNFQQTKQFISGKGKMTINEFRHF